MRPNQRIKILFENRLFSHTLFWITYVLFHAILYGSFSENYEEEFTIQMINLPVKILVTYFTLYYILPRFILPGKWLLFAVIFTLTVILAGLGQRAMQYYIEFPLYYPGDIQHGYFLPLKILKSAVYVYPPVFLAMAIKLLKYWYVDQKEKQLLANEKLETELKFLKTQIHPHFLFNTLNNLYALTLKRSDKAPEMVLKLSDLMNYMLYECNANKVPLANEINFVNNYLEIEKMRHGDNLKVSFDVKGDAKKTFIAPMIILPFLENCFKHGANEELERSWVSLELTIENQYLHLKIENSKSDTQELVNNVEGEGIGLINVKRRLDLLYKDGYKLNVVDEDSFYLVILDIKLSN